MSRLRMMSKLAAVAAISTLAVLPAQAEEMSKEQIEEIVHDYLLENPEIIREAILLLQQREEQAKASQEAAALEQMASYLTESPLDPIGGNPEGTLTMVEFFDYNCGYCKRSNSTVQALISANPNLRVVYKEWPILSDSSEVIARIALAANLVAPEKYQSLHQALMDARSLRTADDVWKVIEKEGLDRAAVEAKLEDEKIDQHFQQTLMLAKQLGITGTPAFIVGDKVLKGAYPVDQIQSAIDQES